MRQSDVESADGVSGKYTTGLGQLEMAVCSDREDTVSMALSVTQALMDKWAVRPGKHH